MAVCCHPLAHMTRARLRVVVPRSTGDSELSATTNVSTLNRSGNMNSGWESAMGCSEVTLYGCARRFWETIGAEFNDMP